jgi:transcriptional regulator of nitric oxide reductase
MEQNHSPKRDAAVRQYPTAESTAGDQGGKVAEPVAAYVHAPSQSITPAKRFIAGISASEAVWRFAVQNDLVQHLEIAVRLVHESFHHAGETRFTYDLDPEIENESWITLWVKVGGPLDNLLKEQAAYRKGMRQAVPLNKLPLIRLFLGTI